MNIIIVYFTCKYIHTMALICIILFHCFQHIVDAGDTPELVKQVSDFLNIYVPLIINQYTNGEANLSEASEKTILAKKNAHTARIEYTKNHKSSDKLTAIELERKAIELERKALSAHENEINCETLNRVSLTDTFMPLFRKYLENKPQLLHDISSLVIANVTNLVSSEVTLEQMYLHPDITYGTELANLIIILQIQSS